MHRAVSRVAFTVVIFAAVCPLFADSKTADEGLPRIEEKTAGLERRDGLFSLWVDRDTGRVWMKLPPAEPGTRTHATVLYVEGLAHGLGSNPVGLDRGKIGGEVIVEMRRVGGKILFEQPNLGFRALSDNPAEINAVGESFATSVLWAGPVAAQDPDGAVLIDLTSFIVRDAFGVATTLKRSGQGSYRLDEARSAIDLEAVLAFPRNLEFEALLTFSGSEPGSFVSEVAPDAQAVTLVQHHSFVALPEPGYRPRDFDPRAGSFPIFFHDYAAPLAAPLDRRWIVRHRLHKTDPRKRRSRVKEPIVYYVDPGTPEPVRQALIDGATWWADAFDAAGFIDAFRVELLPPGAHPLDVRYNVIQWVHRSTRGWSYGGGVIDPRTGEMIKGHVSLGSLRVRQDRLLFEGLLGTAGTGSGAADDPVQLALARIRQLSAHEVGHTLGLAHNFAASTYGRASVMDYPAPLVRVDGDRLDVTQAYGVGVGAWDRHAIRWAYAEFADPADEPAGLDAIVREGLAAGLLFLSDQDARPAGAAHPLANLWDNGPDPVEELRRSLEVRRHALDRFGENNVAVGQPLARLEEVLATVYLHHRYQLDAAVKSVGGADYRYGLAGDGQPTMSALPAERQTDALAAVLSVLEPETLDIPERVLEQVLPRPFGYGSNRELFRGRTAPLFDALGAAATAADQVVAGLLQPQRCARLVDQHRRDAALPGLNDMLHRLLTATFAHSSDSPRLREIEHVVQRVVVDRMIELAADPRATSAVQAGVRHAMSRLARGLASNDGLAATRQPDRRRAASAMR
ncbi:MAG: DUF5117 domain-containing protein [Acidobacteria bacterium]|nr:DUF5117 domain-containing protein [Acidobacteriota bacterium]NIM62189.1 DUF5117 domain-containing protein [Acidobacteriota bacterium]NIO58983.1 DUF5117 domain-containing protein [Acidobacteriota bacterium]NIQ30029.1 DUF5117 domain-containing protein [Acidobacteriota bacterium]NIQ84795.1 DUF5117 domain-containing protein [Acidobacteriota bacterium]